ncbi:hypothetical protein HDV00_001758, partial [Rhizophlyctis rosea]
DWYMTEGIELTEYVELKESFIDAFKATGRTAVRDAKTKWEKCRQGAYDVKTYGATFSKRLGNLQQARLEAGYGELDTQSIIDQWTDGLRSNMLRSKVLENTFASFADVKDFCVGYEKKVYRWSGTYKEELGGSSKNEEDDTASESEEADDDSDDEEPRKPKARKGKKAESTMKTSAKRSLTADGVTSKTFNDLKRMFEQEREKNLDREAEHRKYMEELTKGMTELRIDLAQSRNQGPLREPLSQSGEMPNKDDEIKRLRAEVNEMKGREGRLILAADREEGKKSIRSKPYEKHKEKRELDKENGETSKTSESVVSGVLQPSGITELGEGD